MRGGCGEGVAEHGAWMGVRNIMVFVADEEQVEFMSPIRWPQTVASACEHRRDIRRVVCCCMVLLACFIVPNLTAYFYSTFQLICDIETVVTPKAHAYTCRAAGHSQPFRDRQYLLL